MRKPLATSSRLPPPTGDVRGRPGSPGLTWGAANQGRMREHAALIRDVFGNPFRRPTLSPSWLTTDVRDLARTVYRDRVFGLMPILADALMEAGCDSPDILNHCRGDGPHVRGCWVVDLLLGLRRPANSRRPAVAV